MIDDPELVETTNSYIRDNLLSAARAFQLRVLEFQSEWRLSGHPMVLDRLNDLLDIQVRILRILLDLPDPEESLAEISHEVVLIARDLTPSLMAQLDRDLVLGIGIDAGSRTSHAAILARSLGIPAVVGLGDLSEFVETGERVILDGRAARVIVEPDEFELNLYRERDIKVREWEEEIARLTLADAVTTDGVEVVIRANIDLPGEAIAAREQGAEGIGLFRTEFLVIGRSQYPGEEEQYAAYRKVVESFPEQPVYIRTFDLGGDKFPLFLEMPPEENPFLGWRAIRVCLDTPELFRTHLRALLRASDYGDLRIMLPMINQRSEEHTSELQSPGPRVLLPSLPTRRSSDLSLYQDLRARRRQVPTLPRDATRREPFPRLARDQGLPRHPRTLPHPPPGTTPRLRLWGPPDHAPDDQPDR